MMPEGSTYRITISKDMVMEKRRHEREPGAKVSADSPTLGLTYYYNSVLSVANLFFVRVGEESGIRSCVRRMKLVSKEAGGFLNFRQALIEWSMLIKFCIALVGIMLPRATQANLVSPACR